MTTSQRKLDAYPAENREAAEIILRDIHRFGGEGALPVLWARLLMAAAQQGAAGDRS